MQHAACPVIPLRLLILVSLCMHIHACNIRLVTACVMLRMAAISPDDVMEAAPSPIAQSSGPGLYTALAAHHHAMQPCCLAESLPVMIDKLVRPTNSMRWLVRSSLSCKLDS